MWIVWKTVLPVCIRWVGRISVHCVNSNVITQTLSTSSSPNTKGQWLLIRFARWLNVQVKKPGYLSDSPSHASAFNSVTADEDPQVFAASSAMSAKASNKVNQRTYDTKPDTKYNDAKATQSANINQVQGSSDNNSKIGEQKGGNQSTNIGSQAPSTSESSSTEREIPALNGTAKVCITGITCAPQPVNPNTPVWPRP